MVGISRLLMVLAAIIVSVFTAAAQADPPDPAQRSPVTCLTHYYRSIDHKVYFDAYKLRSPQARKETPWQAFVKQWDKNLSVKLSDASIQSQHPNAAVVTYSLDALDLDGKSLTPSRGSYAAVAELVQIDGNWWIEKISARLLKTLPAPELELYDSSVNIVKDRPAAPFPKDIPVYTGFRLSAPMAAQAQQRGMDKAFNLAISINRQAEVYPGQIADFYEKEMKKRGWRSSGPAGGGSSLSIKYTQKSREVLISAYRHQVSGNETPQDPRGTRLEIWYR